MKLFKLKRKNIILVSLLAVAGFLGISSVAVNTAASKETPVAEKADAAGNRVIYIVDQMNARDSSAGFSFRTSSTADSGGWNFSGNVQYYNSYDSGTGDWHAIYSALVPDGTTGYVIRTNGSGGAHWNHTNSSFTVNGSFNVIYLTGWGSGQMNSSPATSTLQVYTGGTAHDATWNTSTGKWTYEAAVDADTKMYAKISIDGRSVYLGYPSSGSFSVSGCTHDTTNLKTQDGHSVYSLQASYNAKYTFSIDGVHMTSYGDPSYDLNNGASSISYKTRYTVSYKGKFFKGSNLVNSTLADLTPAVAGDNYVYSGETFTANASEWSTYSYTDSSGITTSYTFKGWYSNETLTTTFTSKANVTANFTIYAKFEDEHTYTIQYYCVCDGVNQTQQQFTYSSSVASGTNYNAMTPTLYGYNFDGWYNDSSCSSSLSSAYVGEDRTFAKSNQCYAKFTRVSTNKTYYIDVTSCVSQFNNYMYVYYWGPNNKNSGQPGILLTSISGISNFYSFSIPYDATGFLVRLNNNNNYQRTVDITPSAEHNLYVINTNYGSGSSNKQSGVWQDVIYYLIGNETFTGNADTAWKTEGGKVMHEPTTDNGNAAEITGVTIPTNPSGHSCGVNIVMIYANAAGDLKSYYYHTLAQSYSFCREYQDVAAGDQGINIYFDNAGGTQFGGTYSFYLKNGSVYVVDDSNKESYGYIYLSCAGSADDIRVTASKSGASTPNLNDVRLSTVTDVQTAGNVTFNSVRNLHKIPVYNLRGNDISQYIKTVVISYGGSSTTYTLNDNDDEPNYYFNYGNSSINEDADIAYAAELAFEFGKAVSGAGNKSVCNITEGTAKQLCSSYDSFMESHSSAASSFTGATINTWNSAKPTYEGDAAYSMNAILYQVSKIAADGTNRGSLGRFGGFSLFGSEDNFSSIIIIISSSVALLSVTALSILVIRKRKSKED